MVTSVGDLGQFLRARRDAADPAHLGIVSYGQRRVPGLRRDELAQLAGVSVAYYTRLEQGQSVNASASVIDAIATALRLNHAERTHLHALARPAPARRRRAARPERPSDGALQLLDAMPEVPALLLGRSTDILGWNRLGHQLFASHLDASAPGWPGERPNQIRLLFRDPHTRELHRRWDEEATRAVASLRYVAGNYPDDRAVAELIGELSMHSREFARLWAHHGVVLCSSGTKYLHHPVVGDLDVHYESMYLPDSEGQRLITHTVTPGSSSEAALRLLIRQTPDANAAIRNPDGTPPTSLSLENTRRERLAWR